MNKNNLPTLIIPDNGSNTVVFVVLGSAMQYLESLGMTKAEGKAMKMAVFYAEIRNDKGWEELAKYINIVKY